MKKVLIYTLRILGWTLLGIVIILLFASVLLQTRPVKNKLTGIAEKQASKVLNGNLTIGRLDGNFFTGIELKDVLLTLGNDTVAYIKELDVSYNPLPLLHGEISLSSANIEAPRIYLEQNQDSTWNVQNLVKPSEPTPNDTTKSGGIDFNIETFSLNNGLVEIDSPDTLLPRKVENIDIQLSFHMADDEQSLDLNKFNLQTTQPDFQLNQLTLNLKRDSDYIELNNFYLKTAQNRLEGKGEFESEPYKQGSANFETSELQLQEFEYFLPSLKLPAKPVVKIDADLDQDSLYVDLSLADNDQKIIINAASGNIIDFLQKNNESPLSYRVSGKLENVEPGHWLGNPALDYFLNGSLAFEGHGTKPKDATFTVKADFNDSRVQNRQLTDLLVDLELDRGNLRGTIDGKGEFGSFWLDPEIQNIFEHPVYNAKLRTQNLNLALLLGNDSLSSDINLTAKIEGEEFDPKKLSATASIHASDSRFQKINLDTLLADIQYHNQNIEIDTLRLETDSLTLRAHGNYSLTANSDVSLNINFEGLQEFSTYIPVSGLKSSGEIQAHVTGTPDSMTIATNVDLGNTLYNEITLESLTMDAEGNLAPGDTTFSAKLLAREIVTGGFRIDSVSADVSGNPDSLYIDSRVSGEDISTHLATGIVPGEKLRLTIADWQINYKDYQLALQQPPAVIEIDSVNYKISNFRMATSSADTAQYIMAEGIASRKNEENLQFEAANINISKISDLLDLDLKAAGLLNVSLSLKGVAEYPVVNGSFKLNDAKFNEYKFTDFGGSFNYKNGQADFHALVVPQDSGKVELEGMLPMEINLDTMGFNLDKQASIDAHASIDSFSLGVLKAFNITGDIQGYLQGQVDVGGTVESPDPKGNINLKNASVNIDEYGIHYNNIQLAIDFLQNSVQLDTLRISSDDGYMTGTGQIDFNTGFYRGDINQSKIRFDFADFNLLDHNQFNVQLDGYATLAGAQDSVIYGGDLKIPEAEIYLPAVMGMFGKISEPEMPKPILLQEAEAMEKPIDSMNIQTYGTIIPDSTTFSYLDNLQGELRVRIPKNTWIKNEDMRLELSGELELRKHAEFFELFGNVDVVRGQYDLFGRTFKITDGSLTFQGGEEISPNLNIDAEYTFRNAERAEQKLTVQITGSAQSPEVSFLLDGQSINEGDALSYILFGKSMDELSLDQQENVQSAGGGSLAEKAAASVLSSQITNFLSDKLNVDYIEVKSNGSFDNATVVVGKYITNDLFVSYEKRFGETDEKDIAKYEVRLEYELFPFLFFELNNSTYDSGFDITVKFDVK